MIKKNEVKDPHNGTFLSSMINKEIMSEIRGGDYQHPGEEEAIEMAFSKIAKNPRQLLLDVGCGRGGTAHYLQQKKWGNVVGIDINSEVLEVARQKYGATPFPVFLCCDVLNVKQTIKNTFIDEVKFDVIFIFGALCLMPNHVKVLQTLKEVVNKQTRLVIFDCIDYGEYSAENPRAENGKILLPNCIKYNEIDETFLAGGWEKPNVKIIDKKFISWYKNLMQKIIAGREKYSAKYGKKAFSIFEQRYRHLSDIIENKTLGGAIIYTIPFI